MKLPSMRYAGSQGRSYQVRFGGYNHTLAAGEGELWDMGNLTGDFAPLLASRPRRRKVRTLESPGGIGSLNGLFWVDGTGFYYEGAKKGDVTAGRKIFAGMGSRIIIFPDKALYNTATDSFEPLEASCTAAAGTAKFDNGTLFEEEAECNTLTCAGIDFNDYFSAGDAVEISGCTKHTENNKTPVIREISEDGHSLRFYEYVFVLDGTDEAPEGYTEPEAVTIARKVPDMDYICVNENRLWGCKGDTIYSSKLGDPKNFNVFDGVGTDSWSVDSGSAGEFTGCCAYLGYPCFFKEDKIFKVYGSLPTNFELMGSATMGVAAGCGGSLAVAGEVLFYIARSGPTAYSGGIPSSIAAPFGGEKFSGAVAGSDGLKYYVSMEDQAGQRHLFVYDTRQGMWHREDGSNAMGFAFEGGLHMLLTNGEVWRLDGQGEGTEEGPVSWYAEFGDFTEGSPNAKGYGKLQIRLEVEEGASAKAEVRYDSRGDWETAGEIGPGAKRTCLLPVVPRRADHYRVRLSGTGGCVVYGMARSYYSGSEHRTF